MTALFGTRLIWGTLQHALLGFPGGSDGKESPCKVGDLGLLPGLERSPEKGMAARSSILARRITWTVQSMVSQRIRHNSATFTRYWVARVSRKSLPETLLRTCSNSMFAYGIPLHHPGGFVFSTMTHAMKRIEGKNWKPASLYLKSHKCFLLSSFHTHKQNQNSTLIF